MKVKKINQSYSYCDAQLKWIEKNLHGGLRIKDMNKKKLEEEFFRTFGIKRTFVAILGQAKRMGLRRKPKLVAGKSIRNSSAGKLPMICVSVDPIKYISLARYNWQKHHGVELGRDDIIIHLDDNPSNCDISNLSLIHRRDLIMMNKLPKSLDTRTKVALAKLEGRVEDLKGQGVWSKEEKDWVASLKISKRAPDKFWVKKANEFNRIFKKSRTSRCLTVAYHRK